VSEWTIHHAPRYRHRTFAEGKAERIKDRTPMKQMSEEGLSSVNYDAETKAVTFVYDDDARFDVAACIAYAFDITDGQTDRVTIYRGDQMAHRYRLTGTGSWSDAVSGNAV
jgi:hypothetical protein